MGVRCISSGKGVTLPTVRISYYDYVKDAGVYKARAKVVNCLKSNNWNISETAKNMDTTRVTVRKIKSLYQKGGWKSLKDSRNGPDAPHNKIAPFWEKKILKDYQDGTIKTLTSFANVFNRKYSTTFSYPVFWRVTKEERMKGKNKRKKKQKGKSEAKLRAKYQGEALLHWQSDPKYLTDIVHFIPQMIRFNLPSYQLGFRDVVSGSTFWFYSYSLGKNVLENAVSAFMYHLKKWNIPVSEVDVQTDNDTAMVSKGKNRSKFTKIVEDVFSANHSQIPPAACWLNGYIESFNNTCEQMFYSVEDYESLEDFVSKAFTWQLTYNLIRPSEALKGKTPYQIVKQKYPHITPRFYLELPPIIFKGDEPSPHIEKPNNSTMSGYLVAKKTKYGR